MIIDRIKRSWPLGWEHLIKDVAEGAYGYGYKNKNYSLLSVPPRPRKLKMYHIGVFSRSNAGDAYLPVILRDLFQTQVGGVKWIKQHAHKVVSEADIEGFNTSDGIVIGGGGLFIPDTNANLVSGWQWPCSTELLRKINCPIFVFAVGYNRFRDQADFAPVFRENVTELVRKSSFFGLRNHGSIERLRKYLPEEIRDKVVFQPCMTTLSSRVYGEAAIAPTDLEGFIAVNCAFDRTKLRFGEKMAYKLEELALSLKALSKTLPLHLVLHAKADEKFSIFLDAHEVPYQVVDLSEAHPRQVMDYYRRPVVTLGMRGHAQMIPFGSNRPIYSLITHNKLRFFLDDISHTEWGCDLNEADFGKKIIKDVEAIVANKSEVIDEMITAQDKLWSVTQANMNIIKNKLSKND